MLNTVKLLLLFTIVYNFVEGVIAITAGLAAESIALIAFGADSYLEVAAAGVVYCRLAINKSLHSNDAEKRIERFIGWTFLALALAVIIQATMSFAGSSGADESPLGISLAITSITLMPAVAMWKLRLAADLNIRSVAAEAKETLACSYLSVTLLVGLTANALLGWWWLDPLTALLLVPWLLREGLEGVQGSENDDDEASHLCSCRVCFYGLRRCGPGCRLADKES